jgi:hypothetical protein
MTAVKLSAPQRLYAWWLSTLDDVTRHIPFPFNTFIGFVAQSAFFAFFLYSFVQQYRSNVNSTFVSLDKSSGNCVAVPKNVTSTFYADSNGYWATNAAFRYVLA